MENSVRWFEIYVQDMVRAKKFYENVFNVKLEKLNVPDEGMEMWSFPMNQNSPGASGALVKMEGMAPGGCGTLVYFGSEDCAAEESRVEKNGGKIHQKKFSIGSYGFITLAMDTEGNMFGVHSMK